MPPSTPTFIQPASTPVIPLESALPNARACPAGMRSGRALSTAGLLALVLVLGACGVRMPQAYSPPLQQGNVIEQEALSKLKPGMTRSQVRFVLGTPLVVDVFRNDRWDYVYLLRRQGEAPQQRRVTVIFDGDLLARVEGDVVPGSGTVPVRPAAKAEAAKPEQKKDPKKDGAAEPQRGFFGRMLDRVGF